MWELDYKESWVPKNWCFWTVVLEKTLQSLLDCKEMQPVNPKGNQFWIFIERMDAEAENPILWPLNAKNWLIGKDPDAGKDWGQKEKGDNRGWDGWMASPTQWTWVWVSSGSWWWTEKPGVLQSWVIKSWTRLSYWIELRTQYGLVKIRALELEKYEFGSGLCHSLAMWFWGPLLALACKMRLTIVLNS